MNSEQAGVAVIIAAFNSASTISRAITSALAQPEVAEVIVVDDGSTDSTAAAAIAADDGTSRLKVLLLHENRGPSAARNRAIEAANAPMLAILDADDFLLPGRFAPMLAVGNWDLITDNVAFASEEGARSLHNEVVRSFRPSVSPITLERFIEGNISRNGRYRGELGFAKPLIRRSFLDENGLRYDESLRLGEDFALYSQVLVSGGRFLLIDSCGYVAIERGGSLSASHATSDLYALLAFDRRFERFDLGSAERRALRRHQRQIEIKAHHRRLLDIKGEAGVLPAMSHAIRHPRLLAGVSGAVVRDKMAGRRRFAGPNGVRYLID